MNREGQRRATIASLITYIALIAFIGRHLIASIGTVVVNDLGDSLLSTAVLTWNAKHIPWSNAWWDFPSFYPTSGTLLFTEHVLGLSFIASPIYWLSGNPFLTYNLACALAMYALVFRLSGSGAASEPYPEDRADPYQYE